MSDPLGDLVVAHLRRLEVGMLSRVLAGTLAGALPARLVTVRRARTPRDRLLRRPGLPVAVTVHAHEKALTLETFDDATVRTTISHAVHGVVLSTATVDLATWLDALAELLDTIAREDESARLALHRALLTDRRGFEQA